MPPQDCTPATTANYPDFDGRKPHAVDVHIGGRVRYRRMVIGMSQEGLAGKLNVTFQQVQKYEGGRNRIGGSRLWQIAKALKVSPAYFFDGLEAGAEVNDGPADDFMDFLKIPGAASLVRNYASLENPKSRQYVASCAKSAAELEGRL
jgi:transcriptional regulator with XRE-family HTH domain